MLFVKAFLLTLLLQWRGVGQFEQVMCISQRQTATSFALLVFSYLQRKTWMQLQLYNRKCTEDAT